METPPITISVRLEATEVTTDLQEGNLSVEFPSSPENGVGLFTTLTELISTQRKMVLSRTLIYLKDCPGLKAATSSHSNIKNMRTFFRSQKFNPQNSL